MYLSFTSNNVFIFTLSSGFRILMSLADRLLLCVDLQLATKTTG